MKLSKPTSAKALAEIVKGVEEGIYFTNQSELFSEVVVPLIAALGDAYNTLYELACLGMDYSMPFVREYCEEAKQDVVEFYTEDLIELFRKVVEKGSNK